MELYEKSMMKNCEKDHKVCVINANRVIYEIKSKSMFSQHGKVRVQTKKS